MPELRPSDPTPPDPRPPFAEQRHRLIAAINWAHVQGLDIALTGELGVVCLSSEGAVHWVRDRAGAGVSPLGAVLLQAQPAARTDPYDAVAAALEMSSMCVVALALGVAGLSPMTSWTALVNCRLMNQAWMLGVEIRSVMRRAVDRLGEEG